MKAYWKTLNYFQKKDIITNICAFIIIAVPILILLVLLTLDCLELKLPKLIIIIASIPLITLEAVSFLCLVNYDILIDYYNFKCKK